MKPTLGVISVAASLLPWLGWGLRCLENEYPLRRWKCCKYCPPGKQLEKRCTDTSETVCEPCEENYYNDAYTYSSCKLCTDCDSERGLRMVRPCQGTSDTICACLPGHSPEESEVEKRCKACPSGYFSRGGDEKCRPWTNCTASGRKTLHPGKEDADAICDAASSEVPTLRPVTQPPPFKTGVSLLTRVPDSSEIVLAKNQGFVWILAIAILLLTAAGLLLLLFFCRRTKKKKARIHCEDIFGVSCKDDSNGYRMPIQEQQIGVKSNFVQG
ncbi:tumor necrosis factor receptor superfamily member 4 [Python bivittatus]|uniref:Tumor necrosis factor receptor superfamily member 4 n=1 Tax=Python bivittatus TaxID=176946 RepID=A0A9F5IID4_PYTBI|nr:tumor necrosis factor receptor superfamily member 4 [Python bivittatus]